MTENMKSNKYGPIALSTHHIYHDKSEGCNGIPFNLIPLCFHCHNKEVSHEDEFKRAINNALTEGFKWGIWNEEEYRLKVIY
jgi:5-methylcytosine-specific restriction endonuclease McrA